MGDGDFSPSRRRLFTRRTRDPVRPPWARLTRFTDLCTRCDKCREACPESIVTRGDGGFPEVDFRLGECSFCHACAEVCPVDGLFAPSQLPPWTIQARVGDGCLTRAGVYCESCRDNCAPRAIHFELALRSVPRPRIDPAACTGCGGCVASCPGGAISIGDTKIGDTGIGEGHG